jgi:hypothetical protein
MLDTRQVLTEILTEHDDLQALGVTIVQEDEFTSTTSRPTIILTYDGAEPTEGTPFRTERWDLWIVVESADYYTIGLIATVLRKLLDKKTPETKTGLYSAVMSFQWVGEGPAVFDQQYRVHTQIQSYIAQTLDIDIGDEG